MHNEKLMPDFIFSWLFQLLQNPNGNIRQSAVRMFSAELGELTTHIRHPEVKFRNSIKPDEADKILFGLETNLRTLADETKKTAYDKFEYIDQLPSSTHKSVMQVLVCLEEYTEVENENFAHIVPVHIAAKQIIIKKELTSFLRKTDIKLNFGQMIDIIYNETGIKDLHRLLGLFMDSNIYLEEPSILQLINDAWNYFPHKSLDGLAPLEIIALNQY